MARPHLSWLMKISSDRRLAGWVCVAIVAGFLLVGWWPLAPFPRNQVSWLTGAPGLQFRPAAIAYDPEPLPESGADGDPSGFALEISLEAALEPDNHRPHILAIHDDRWPSNLVLWQWKSELVLHARGFREVAMAGLHKGKRRLITLSSDPDGVGLYVDGKLAERVPRRSQPMESLRGRVILGNSAGGNQSWSGNVFGLAIFNRALSAGEVTARHVAWSNRVVPELVNDRGLAALYLFDEGNGEYAADRSANRHQLFLPPRFHIMHKTVVGFPRSGRLLKSGISDFIVNILGFIPFGFFLFQYRRSRAPGSRWLGVGLVTLSGAMMSLIIEIGQGWLHTRDSSVVDVYCNLTGAALGALLAVWIFRRSGSEPSSIPAAAEPLHSE